MMSELELPGYLFDELTCRFKNGRMGNQREIKVNFYRI